MSLLGRFRILFRGRSMLSVSDSPTSPIAAGSVEDSGWAEPPGRGFEAWDEHVPPPNEVLIVDGVGGQAAERVAMALEERGIRCRRITADELTRPALGVMLLLPMTRTVLDEHRAGEYLATLQLYAGDPVAAARFTAPVLIVWCVRHGDRAVLAVPLPPRRNHAEVLLANAWRTELRNHADEVEAVRCRSARVAGLALDHGVLADVTVRDLRRAVNILTPACLHSLIVHTNGSWSDTAAVAAAIAALVDE